VFWGVSGPKRIAGLRRGCHRVGKVAKHKGKTPTDKAARRETEKMNETSRDIPRIAFISALFGILAAVVAGWAFEYSGFGAIVIGLLVAAIVWIILWLGWTEPQSAAKPQQSAATPAPVAKASATAAAATTSAATAATAAVATMPAAAPVADVAPAAKPAAAKAAKPAAAKAAKPAAAKAAKPAAAKAAKPAAEKVAKPAAAKAAKPAAAKAAKPAAAKAAKPAVAKAAKPAAEKAAKPAAAKAAKPAAAKAPKAPKAAPAKPEVLSKARDGGADDLKMIKGVGPVLEKALNASGVFHFDQVAAWKKADATWFDDNVKGANGRVIRDEWVKQAKILAKGGTTAFASKVKKGGVY